MPEGGWATVRRSAAPGRIVLLNGPSSSGKTTLSEALAELLRTPWHIFPVDAVHAMRSRPDLRGHVDIDWQQVFRTSRAGYHCAVAGLATAGCDVIADHVLDEPWRLLDLLRVTVDLDVLLVHVDCSPKVLSEREARRGDREPGTAVRQLALVFAHADCDLTVDTTAASAELCAREVASLLDSPFQERAFDRLRHRWLGEER
jgi:chloramphenicol 3-O phosphotransferase